MRDPARIDRVVELLRQAWHQAPDQRLGQLVENLLYSTRRSVPAWFAEDDLAERKLEAFLRGGFAASSEVTS